MTKRDPRRGKGRKHVRLDEWVQATTAWTSLKPGPRALYVELKRRYNGGNNGRIPMSYREAAQLLNVHRNTVGGFFDELEDRGLIRETKRGHLGADGHGIASTWALCELPTADGKPPDTGFRTWQPKQKPVTKTVQPCHSNCASPADLPKIGSGPTQ